MAQLNDLLVAGQASLLGDTKIDNLQVGELIDSNGATGSTG
jgi:hypothetical protein